MYYVLHTIFFTQISIIFLIFSLQELFHWNPTYYTHYIHRFSTISFFLSFPIFSLTKYTGDSRLETRDWRPGDWKKKSDGKDSSCRSTHFLLFIFYSLFFSSTLVPFSFLFNTISVFLYIWIFAFLSSPLSSQFQLELHSILNIEHTTHIFFVCFGFDFDFGFGFHWRVHNNSVK